MEEDRIALKIVTGTARDTLGRPSHRWEDNIRTDLKYNKYVSIGELG